MKPFPSPPKKIRILEFTTAMLTIATACVADAEPAVGLKLPAIFGNHMVLQQGRELPVWGQAKPGEKVSVTLNGKNVETAADDAGHWKLNLPSFPTSKEPMEMTVKSGADTITYTDVIFGDVWLCSGQSNMAMGVGAQNRSKEIIAGANNPQLRLFLVHRQVSFQPASDLVGKWAVCSPDTITMEGGWMGFSAVGYFFGQAIQRSQNIPVGLIGSYVGGTNIISWTSRETLSAAPAGSIANKRFLQFDRDMKEQPESVRKYNEELKPAWDKALPRRNAKLSAEMKAWKSKQAEAKLSGQTLPPRPQAPPAPKNPLANFNQATSLYNGMIYPLAPIALTGAIWYQGEANAYDNMAMEYKDNLRAMIENWRQLWGQGDFPFLVVQLPNRVSDKDTWPVLRESQRLAIMETPNTGMAITYDIGDPNDLHPAEKQAVGERLALVARSMVYKEDIVPGGPMIESAKQENGKIVLTFKNIGGGLMAGAITKPEFRAKKSNEDIRGFEVAGEEGNYFPAKATIEGGKLIVQAEGKGPATSVRYAWAQNPNGNLYNMEGLPASPFQTTVSSP